MAAHLLGPHSPISTSTSTASHSDPARLLPPRFFNDLDLAPRGDEIVFSDSSYKFTRAENRKEVLDGAPRGRLFLFTPSTQRLQVLLCGLHFPNGVQFLSPHEVLVAELARFRVLKVNLSAPGLAGDPSSGLHGFTSCAEESSYLRAALLLRGSDEDEEGVARQYASSGVGIYLDSVPGIVDNVRRNSFQGRLAGAPPCFYLGLGSKSAQPFSLLWLGYQSFLLRDIIGGLQTHTSLCIMHCIT